MKKFAVFITIVEMLSELWWASIPPPPSLMTIIKNSCNRCGQGYSGKGTLTCWCHVGVWTRATTMEVSLKLPQKSKNRITSCITSGSITKRIQVSMPRRELDKLVHFHVTTPKLQTHRLPSPDALPSSLALYCLQENGNENYHIEWSKPDAEREISYFLS